MKGASSDLRELFDDLREFGDGLLRVSVLDPVADAVLNMPFHDDLTDLVNGALDGVHLHDDVFAGDVLIDHAVDGRDLSRNLLEPPVEVLRIHALLHACYVCADRIKGVPKWERWADRHSYPPDRGGGLL